MQFVGAAGCVFSGVHRQCAPLRCVHAILSGVHRWAVLVLSGVHIFVIYVKRCTPLWCAKLRVVFPAGYSSIGDATNKQKTKQLHRWVVWVFALCCTTEACHVGQFANKIGCRFLRWARAP